MAAETPYEIRCLHCDTSFAAETKACVHCGRPLRSGLAGLLSGAQPMGESSEPLGEPQEGEGVEGFQLRSRNIVWVVTAILAAVLSGLRSCGG